MTRKFKAETNTTSGSSKKVPEPLAAKQERTWTANYQANEETANDVSKKATIAAESNSLVSSSTIVLSYKNKMYKDKMYDLYRSYEDRCIYREEKLKDAKLILQQLKHAANGFGHSHSYNESCSESIETTYLKYSPDNNCYAVSEDTALKSK